MTIQEQVRSADRTPIAIEISGTGPGIVLVGGAFAERAFPLIRELAAILSERFTVISYDRRGRGDSGDAPEYAVAREVEDLAAVLDRLDAPATVWGLSSGAALTIEAAAAGVTMSGAVLYEPAYDLDTAPRHPRGEIAAEVDRLLDAGDRSGAVRVFMNRALHVPSVITAIMRLTPAWRRLTGLAHTLPYDLAVTAVDLSRGKSAPARWRNIAVPVEVLIGERSPAGLRQAGDAVAQAIPAATLRTLAGQNHVIKPPVVAAAITDFIGALAQ